MRIFVLVIIVVTIVILALGVFLFITRGGKTEPTSNENAATTAQGEMMVPTPVVLKGDILVNKEVNYRGVTLSIDTALKTKEFHRRRAASGTEFVVMFLEPFATDPTTNPVGWAARDVRLQDQGSLNVAPREVSIPNRAGVEGGYLSFNVPEGSEHFLLSVGSGASTTSIELGF